VLPERVAANILPLSVSPSTVARCTALCTKKTSNARLSSSRVILPNEQLPFDYVIVSPGTRHSYFGHDEWEPHAPGLKTLADALNIRERVLLSFEQAVRRTHTPDARKFLTFCIVGGGSTGVELAGALAEIACKSVLPDFRTLRPHDITILLLEAGSRVLAAVHPIVLATSASCAGEQSSQSVCNRKENSSQSNRARRLRPERRHEAAIVSGPAW
jgi:hypothetical protein